VITLDSSAILALSDQTELEHTTVVAALRNDPGPYLVPAGILSEVAYMLDVRVGRRVTGRFLVDLETGAYTLDCGERDLPRTRELVSRYGDLPLGYADAAVITCAERHGGRVLSLDRRDFNVVAREGTITVVP
jgi:predicted nucleic acid-binding protein